MQRTIRTRRPRVAFTMIEMLVVISIIVGLIGISVAVYANMMETARRAATMATILKVDKLLQQQINAWNREHRDSELVEQRADVYRDGRLPATLFYRMLNPGARGGEALAVKDFFRLHFAQTRHDAYGFDYMEGTADDVSIYRDWISGNKPSVADSSELLYIALTKGRIRSGDAVDADEFAARELGDTDEDELLEFIDGWGNPLRFYRWPTRLLNPFGFVATTLTSSVDNTSTTLDVNDGSAFQQIFTDLGPTMRIHVVVGREIMQVTAANATSLTVVRGSESTDVEQHPNGSLVKLAPLFDFVSLVFGSLNPSTVAHDVDDPRGDLINGSALNDSDMTSDGAITDFEAYFHTLDSFHTPLIVSAGSDGVLGLGEPTQTVDTAMDNPSWGPGTGLNVDRWRWGRLAQPETNGGTDFSLILDPLNSTLNDNLTNQMSGLRN